MLGISNDDFAAEVKNQACVLKSVKTDLTTRMDTLETIVQQLLRTVENLRQDIQ